MASRMHLISSKASIIVLAGVATIGVAALVLMGRGGSAGSPSADGRSPVEALGGQFAYPNEWRTTLDEAISRSKFPVPVPNHDRANRSRLVDVYQPPEAGSIALVFPPPDSDQAVNAAQRRLEIYAEPWTNGDPRALWDRHIRLIGKSASIIQVKGVDALAVEPKNDFDPQGDNPAFLRFVWKDVDVTIQGGANLQSVIEIAESLRME